MNLNDTRLIFVVSPSDEGDKSLETVKEVIGQLIKDDKKNRRNDIVYVSSLNTFNWMSDIVDKDECNIIKYLINVIDYNKGCNMKEDYVKTCNMLK